jgi:UDP:flavonoid glycosyltransferase YjiC (YdhE family)
MLAYHNRSQPFWAEVMRRKNLTVEAIPIAELNQDNLAKAIRDVLADKNILKSCQEMREVVLKEDGIAETIRIIRSLLN